MLRSLFLGVCALAIAASAFGADPVLIKLSCDAEPFPKCVTLQKEMIEGSTSHKGFNGAVAELLGDVYLGKVKVSPESGSCTTLNLIGKPEICPPLKISENGCRDEFRVNRESKSCADFARVGPKGDNSYYYTLGRSSSGSLETANVSGGLVLAISDRAVDLATEIRKNALAIAPSSPCFTQAIALQKLVKSQTDVKLLGLVSTCDVTNTETCSTKKYFEATQSNIHSAYLMLARCRLTDEATSKFRTFAADYHKRIEDVVVKDCFYNNSRSPAGMKSCYQSRYTNWIRARAKESFPNVATACQN